MKENYCMKCSALLVGVLLLFLSVGFFGCKEGIAFKDLNSETNLPNEMVIGSIKVGYPDGFQTMDPDDPQFSSATDRLIGGALTSSAGCFYSSSVQFTLQYSENSSGVTLTDAEKAINALGKSVGHKIENTSYTRDSLDMDRITVNGLPALMYSTVLSVRDTDNPSSGRGICLVLADGDGHVRGQLQGVFMDTDEYERNRTIYDSIFASMTILG